MAQPSRSDRDFASPGLGGADTTGQAVDSSPTPEPVTILSRAKTVVNLKRAAWPYYAFLVGTILVLYALIITVVVVGSW